VLIWLEMVVWMLSVAAHWVVGIGFCICVGSGISHLREDLSSGSKLSHTFLILQFGFELVRRPAGLCIGA